MRNGLLTAYVETGFHYLKQIAKLPDGLMPDFADVARQLGDEAMLDMAEPLGLGDRLKSRLAQALDEQVVVIASFPIHTDSDFVLL